jgi:hypothetical protein
VVSPPYFKYSFPETGIDPRDPQHVISILALSVERSLSKENFRFYLESNHENTKSGTHSAGAPAAHALPQRTRLRGVCAAGAPRELEIKISFLPCFNSCVLS